MGGSNDDSGLADQQRKELAKQEKTRTEEDRRIQEERINLLRRRRGRFGEGAGGISLFAAPTLTPGRQLSPFERAAGRSGTLG